MVMDLARVELAASCCLGNLKLYHLKFSVKLFRQPDEAVALELLHVFGEAF